MASSPEIKSFVWKMPLGQTRVVKFLSVCVKVIAIKTNMTQRSEKHIALEKNPKVWLAFHGFVII